MGLLNVGESISHSKGAMGLLLGGAFAAGAIKKSGRSVIEAGNEAAFGDPNADKYFMGQQGLSPSGVFDAYTNSGGAQMATAASAGLGALGGGLIAGAASKMIKSGKGLDKAVQISEKVPLIGGKTLLKAGKAGKTPGLVAAGVIAGAAIGATQFAGRYVNRNKDFFQQSPYSRGSAMQASSTQAYGDIVLGMHNSRRG